MYLLILLYHIETHLSIGFENFFLKIFIAGSRLRVNWCDGKRSTAPPTGTLKGNKPYKNEKEMTLMTYKEYKSVVIKYLLRCLEIEVQDRFADMQWERVENGTALLRCPVTNSEELEFNLIVTAKYLRAERARLYSAIDKDLLRSNSPRQLRQKLVTEYLNDVSDWHFLNAVRVTNWKPGSRHSVKYYLVGGIV